MYTELCHRYDKGAGRKEHKYTKRYWKNGRWNYEYSDTPIKDSNKANSIEYYTHDTHKVVLPKKWASDTNEWNGAFVNSFVKNEKAKNIDKEYAEKFNPKYNPYVYKDPSWIDKVKDKLGYDEGYNYRKAERIKKDRDDYAKRKRDEADTAYNIYKRLPDDWSYESYQLAENMAQMTKADAETAGKLYTKAQEKFFETPIGKIHKAREEFSVSVDAFIDTVSKRLKKKRKK